jgi:cell division protein ZapA
MKQLEVQIMGQSYLLGCPDGGETRLLQAVERVDTAMCKIRDAGKVRARERIAVLASLNLAFELSDHRVEMPVEASAAQVAAIVPPLLPDASAAQAVTGSFAAARDPVLTSLLERLDNALSDDGQLI